MLILVFAEWGLNIFPISNQFHTIIHDYMGLHKLVPDFPILQLEIENWIKFITYKVKYLCKWNSSAKEKIVHVF